MSHKLFKLSVLVVCVVFALTLATGVTAADKVKVGFLLKTMQEERYQRDKADFTKKAESMGAEVVFDSANNDEQTQLSCMTIMSSGPLTSMESYPTTFTPSAFADFTMFPAVPVFTGCNTMT